ncbi:mid1-interacting protein 1-like [Acipenser ruthenus]|uniref:mid1-interacting protein 1-like n=1 Tax=Acipenser ruthenus TaxID=7906 RepID=UPI002741A677|nr:mid1-interacting protein 1-like [Acipenser ruthenus]
MMMMQMNSECINPKHSLLNVMNKFIAATNNMDETVMVPSLLRDVPLEEEDPKLNNNIICPSKQGDMYEHYLLLKSIKSDMEWGLLRREMNGGAGFLEMAVKSGEENSAEDGADLEQQFHYHLQGIFGVLSKLTVMANRCTNRYKREIGGSGCTA